MCLLLTVLTVSLGLQAQEQNSLNTYSPYSIYGFGDMAQPSMAHTRGLGGISQGMRDMYQIDYFNPASATAQDSFSFMLNFGMEQSNLYIHSSSQFTSNNSLNFNHIAISFPVRRLGIQMVLAPYSFVGYDMQERILDDETILNHGDVRYIYRGEGGFNRLILNAAYPVRPNLSLGLSTQYYFGSLNRFYNLAFLEDPTSSSQLNNTKTRIGDVAFAFGGQYYTKWRGKKLTVGGTYQPRQALSTTLNQLSTIESDITVDTVGIASEQKAKSYLPHQLSLGFTLSAPDRWLLGMDLDFAAWKQASLVGNQGELGNTFTVRMGGSYTPNRYDVRYFSKRMTYKGGLRYGILPVVINDQRVHDMALSLGLGIPFRTRSITFLNLAAEIGMRGKTAHGLLRENYWSISASFTFWDRWFLKYKYE